MHARWSTRAGESVWTQGQPLQPEPEHVSTRWPFVSGHGMSCSGQTAAIAATRSRPLRVQVAFVLRAVARATPAPLKCFPRAYTLSTRLEPQQFGYELFAALSRHRHVTTIDGQRQPIRILPQAFARHQSLPSKPPSSFIPRRGQGSSRPQDGVVRPVRHRVRP